MSKTDLIIIGAGGSSQDILETVEDINRVRDTWNILGFLDDDSSKHGKKALGIPIIGSVEDALDFPNAKFILGIASYKDPTTRKRIIAKLQLPRHAYATIIHPSAQISPRTDIGVGTAILHQCIVSCSTKIGDHVLICQGTFIAHDDIIEDHVVFSGNVTLSGGVCIRDSAYIGARACVAPAVEVGAASIVGIGSVAISDVRAGSTVFGSPARIINTGELRRWGPA